VDTMDILMDIMDTMDKSKSNIPISILKEEKHVIKQT